MPPSATGRALARLDERSARSSARTTRARLARHAANGSVARASHGEMGRVAQDGYLYRIDRNADGIRVGNADAWIAAGGNR